eukprot:86255-Chlamydomonas_euryale.AAC.1
MQVQTRSATLGSDFIPLSALKKGGHASLVGYERRGWAAGPRRRNTCEQVQRREKLKRKLAKATEDWLVATDGYPEEASKAVAMTDASVAAAAEEAATSMPPPPPPIAEPTAAAAAAAAEGGGGDVLGTDDDAGPPRRAARAAAIAAAAARVAALDSEDMLEGDVSGVTPRMLPPASAISLRDGVAGGGG